MRRILFILMCLALGLMITGCGPNNKRITTRACASTATKPCAFPDGSTLQPGASVTQQEEYSDATAHAQAQLAMVQNHPPRLKLEGVGSIKAADEKKGMSIAVWDAELLRGFTQYIHPGWKILKEGLTGATAVGSILAFGWGMDKLVQGIRVDNNLMPGGLSNGRDGINIFGNSNNVQFNRPFTITLPEAPAS